MEVDGAAPWLQPDRLAGGWLQPHPSPNDPIQVSVPEKCPWGPAWKPRLMFFRRWSGWGSGAALVSTRCVRKPPISLVPPVVTSYGVLNLWTSSGFSLIHSRHIP